LRYSNSLIYSTLRNYQNGPRIALNELNIGSRSV
jgi:hypothetical protein